MLMWWMWKRAGYWTNKPSIACCSKLPPRSASPDAMQITQVFIKQVYLANKIKAMSQ
jgi:hypothetical protein